MFVDVEASRWVISRVVIYPHRAYSSLMIFSTLRTMLPTVVSDGWAAVILLPSFRMISIRSPERGGNIKSSQRLLVLAWYLITTIAK